MKARSAGSLAALRFAFDEATRRAAGLLVVTAFELPDVWSITYELPVSTSEKQVREDVLENTRRIVTEALGDQLTADGAPDVAIAAQGGGAAQVLVSAAAGSDPVAPVNRLECPPVSGGELSGAITAISVSAVMSRDVLVIGLQDPVVEVWQRMREAGTPVAVVCEDTRVVAVISQHTLAVWWPCGGPGEMHRRCVRDVTEPGTPTLHADATVHEAADLITRLHRLRIRRPRRYRRCAI